MSAESAGQGVARCPRCGGTAGSAHVCRPEQAAHARTLLPDETSPITPENADRLIGKILGNYRVDAIIGAGGMGVVYRAEHISLRKPFALKLLSSDLVRHPDALARFKNEAHAASQLDHENIVNVTDFGVSPDGTPYIVMELLRGRTLAERLAEGPMITVDVLAVVLPVGDALSVAHAAGIVHRDLKPENIFLAERSGRRVVKVLDFGISKLGQVSESPLTVRGQVLGSPRYMSPEACRGDEVDGRADVYAMGVVLYELFCGAPPFDDPNLLRVMQLQISRAPAPPRSHRPDLPESIEAVILHALAKEPADRPQTIDDLMGELIGAVPEAEDLLRALAAPQVLPRAVTPLPWGSGRLPASSGTNPSDPSSAGGNASPVAARPTPASNPPATRGFTDEHTEAVSAPAAPSGAWRIAAGVALIAIGGVGVWLLLRGPTAPAPKPPSPAATNLAPVPVPAPVPDPVPVPTMPPPAPTSVRLSVTTTPAGARVMLDGVLLGSTPLVREVPRKSTRGKLVMTLRGHAPATRMVGLEDQATVVVTLAPLATPVVRPDTGLEIKDQR